MSESTNPDDTARHLANLEDMKAAHVAKMQEWANEDAAREQMRAEWRASFEAGLTHFADVTGLHSEVTPLISEVRGEPAIVPPEPVYTGLEQPANTHDTRGAQQATNMATSDLPQQPRAEEALAAEKVAEREADHD